MITENGTQPRQIDGVYWVQNVRLTTRHSLLMNQSGTGFHHKYIQNFKDSSGIQFAISIILSLSPILVFKYKMVPGVAIIEFIGVSLPICLRGRCKFSFYSWIDPILDKMGVLLIEMNNAIATKKACIRNATEERMKVRCEARSE